MTLKFFTMKKIYIYQKIIVFCFVLFCFVYNANGQLSYINNFSSPAEQSEFTIITESGSATWNYVSTMTNPVQTPSFGSEMLYFNSDAFASGASALLISPDFDLTTTSAGSEPFFRLYFDRDDGDYGFDDRIEVLVSTTGGSPWTLIETFSRYYVATAPATSPEWLEHMVSLSQYASSTNLTIAIRGISEQGNNMAIDRFELDESDCVVASNYSSANVTTNSADVSWTVSTSPTSSHYVLKYAEQGTNAYQYILVADPTSTINITNLLPNTTYDWSIRTICSSNPSSPQGYSSINLFTTLAGGCAAPTNLNTIASDNSTVVSWDAVAGADFYTVKYRRTTEPPSTWDYAPAVNAPAISTTLINLNASYNYEWQIKTTCLSTLATPYVPVPGEFFTTLIQTLPYINDMTTVSEKADITRLNESGSADWTFETSMTAPVQTPLFGTPIPEMAYFNSFDYNAGDSALLITTPFDLTSVTPGTEPYLSVYFNRDDGDIFSDDRVKILVSTDGGSNWMENDVWSRYNPAASQWLSHSTSLAEQATDNNVLIAFRGISENGMNMAIDRIELNESTCLVASNLTTTNILPNSADVGWTNSPSATLYVVKYKVSGTNSYYYKLAGTNPFSLTALLPNTKYDWKIRTICGADAGQGYAYNGSFTTPEGGCEFPTSLTSVADYNDAVLSWDPVPGATEYVVRYREVNGPSWTYVTALAPNNSITLNSLSSNTQYEWFIHSNCGAVICGWFPYTNNGELFTTKTVISFDLDAQTSYSLPFFDVIVRIRTTTGSDTPFNLGSSNIRLNYDPNAVLLPVILTNHNFSSFPYYPLNLSFGSNSISVNVVLDFLEIFNGQSVPIGTWTDIMTVRFNVVNPLLPHGISFNTYSDFPNSILFSDDFITVIPEGNYTVTNAKLFYPDNNYINDLIIAPNPASEYTYISFNAKNEGNCEIELMDLLAKRIFIKSVEVNEGKNFHRINVNELNPGLYFVKLKTKQNEYVSKIVVQ